MATVCTPLTADSTVHTADTTSITADATEFCVEVTTVDGGSVRRRHGRRIRPNERHREDYTREQRMVDEYLQALDEKAQAEQQAKRAQQQPARTAKKHKAAEPAVPVLTEAMARAASEVQLRRIAEHTQSEERARLMAAAESRRRRLIAVMLLAIDD